MVKTKFDIVCDPLLKVKLLLFHVEKAIKISKTRDVCLLVDLDGFSIKTLDKSRFIFIF